MTNNDILLLVVMLALISWLVMISWLVIFVYPLIFNKERAISKIKIKLAGARAEWAMERQVIRSSGEIFPIRVAELTREIAELEERLRQLEGRPENTEHRANPL